MALFFGTNFKALAVALNQEAEHIARIAVERKRHAEKHGKGFVLLMGEYHSRPTHMILEMLVIEKLRAQGMQVNLSLETSHDLVQRLITQAIGQEKAYEQGELRDMHKHFPSDPSFELKFTYGKSQALYAPIAHYAFVQFLLKHKVKASFNDASFGVDGNLDMKDPQVIFYAGQILKGCKGQCSFGEDDGMHIRNAVTAGRIKSELQNTESDITVHICGRMHMAYREGETDEETILPAQLRQRGIDTLSVYMADKKENNIGKSDFSAGGVYITALPVTKEYTLHDDGYSAERELVYLIKTFKALGWPVQSLYGLYEDVEKWEEMADDWVVKMQKKFG